jgi:murein L,D-transpeptidase YafK
MKKSIIVIYILMVIFLASTLVAQIPSSNRSKAAIAKVTPRIEKELEEKSLSYGAQVFARIFKESKELEVWLKKGQAFEHFKTYSICTYGSEGLGPKVKQGDGKAPEGFYLITPQSMNPVSSFHLALNLGYPNAYDRAHKRTGSALMIHGNCVSIGCYAMTDQKIEEIFSLVDAAFRNGQASIQIHIFPFRMTDKNISRHAGSKWVSFWQNLKDGYDYFEEKHIPPDIKLENKRYINTSWKNEKTPRSAVARSFYRPFKRIVNSLLFRLILLLPNPGPFQAVL